jgi:hypothetical protein
MAFRVRNRNAAPKTSQGAPASDGKLIAGKHGVYMVRGHGKLKSIRLIPWEELLASSCPSGEQAVAPKSE